VVVPIDIGMVDTHHIIYRSGGPDIYRDGRHAPQLFTEVVVPIDIGMVDTHHIIYRSGGPDRYRDGRHAPHYLPKWWNW
jgi:hypothetical protein